MWNYITSPFPDFNSATVEVSDWISNFTSHCTGYDYVSMLGLKLIHVSKTGPINPSWRMWVRLTSPEPQHYRCSKPVHIVNVQLASKKWRWLRDSLYFWINHTIQYLVFPYHFYKIPVFPQHIVLLSLWKCRFHHLQYISITVDCPLILCTECPLWESSSLLDRLDLVIVVWEKSCLKMVEKGP